MKPIWKCNIGPNNKDQVIIGIDPGLNATGYGVLRSRRGKVSAVEFGIIKSYAKDDFLDKLHRIFIEVGYLVENFKPDWLAIEDVFVSKNPRSALKLGHARAAAIVAAISRHVDVAEYTPREVKMSVLGNGAGSKEQVQFMVQRLLNLAEPPKPLDASDALAVGLTHLQRQNWQELKKTGNV